MLNSDFLNRLYKGFEAEYYVIGKFFSLGYEAYKAPADFGFDLVVTNQKMQALNNYNNDQNLFPFSIQVKSLHIEELAVQLRGDRNVISFFIKIKNDDIDLIISTGNSFLVVVIFIEGSNKKFNERPILFWFNSKNIQKLKQMSYLIEDANKPNLYNLKGEVRFFPTAKREDIINRLNSINNTSNPDHCAKCIQFINNNIPEYFDKNWRASEYIALTRKSFKANYDQPVNRKIPEHFCDFERLSVVQEDLGDLLK